MAEEGQAETRIVTDPSQAIKADAPPVKPEPAKAEPAKPSPLDKAPGGDVRGLADDMSHREFMDVLWHAAENLRPADADVRKLKWIVQAMAKRLRDSAPGK